MRGRFLQLRLGRCRYGLMLKEDGTIFDDGVTVRLGESRYLLHTTTGNAEAVFAWLERWRQTEWPELKVYLTSVTDHWATAAVAGPQAREGAAPSLCGHRPVRPGLSLHVRTAGPGGRPAGRGCCALASAANFALR